MVYRLNIPYIDSLGFSRYLFVGIITLNTFCAKLDGAVVSIVSFLVYPDPCKIDWI